MILYSGSVHTFGGGGAQGGGWQWPKLIKNYSLNIWGEDENDDITFSLDYTFLDQASSGMLKAKYFW